MFRFTIRDVLWLTVVVAMGVAWWIEHGQHVAVRQSLNEESRGKLNAEWGWQTTVVEHNKTLRLIEESGLVTASHKDGPTVLMKNNPAPPQPTPGLHGSPATLIEP